MVFWDLSRFQFSVINFNFNDSFRHVFYTVTHFLRLCQKRLIKKCHNPVDHKKEIWTIFLILLFFKKKNTLKLFLRSQSHFSVICRFQHGQKAIEAEFQTSRKASRTRSPKIWLNDLFFTENYFNCFATRSHWHWDQL